MEDGLGHPLLPEVCVSFLFLRRFSRPIIMLRVAVSTLLFWISWIFLRTETLPTEPAGFHSGHGENNFRNHRCIAVQYLCCWTTPLGLPSYKVRTTKTVTIKAGKCFEVPFQMASTTSATAVYLSLLMPRLPLSRISFGTRAATSTRSVACGPVSSLGVWRFWVWSPSWSSQRLQKWCPLCPYFDPPGGSQV